MPVPVSSSFSTNYYVRAFLGAAVLLAATGYMLYNCISGGFEQSGGFVSNALLCAGVGLFYFIFSKSWLRIMVADEGITVFRVFKKPLIILWADITAINTYRARSSGANPTFGGLTPNFVIEFNHNQTISFNEAWYDNYDKLTMAIYLHKYGPGHGRERYLARHGITT
jgi:hypothetical protein